MGWNRGGGPRGGGGGGGAAGADAQNECFHHSIQFSFFFVRAPLFRPYFMGHFSSPPFFLWVVSIYFG